jgi:hypothetical protein
MQVMLLLPLVLIVTAGTTTTRMREMFLGAEVTRLLKTAMRMKRYVICAPCRNGVYL